MSLDTEKLGGPYATVIDVGAFRGDFARAALAKWHRARVLSFEPLEPAPKIPVGFRRRWSWHACALGDRCEVVTINANEFIPSSSMLPMLDLHREAFPYTEATRQVQVGMAMLDEFFSMIESPALLKIDVQGFELEVLKGGVEVLSQCAAVVAEVSWESLYEGAPDFDDLDSFLGSRGFEYGHTVDRLDYPDSPELRVLQTDELWVRA